MSDCIPASVWKQTFERHGAVPIKEMGELKEDPFAFLSVNAANEKANGRPTAEVSMSLSTSNDFGQQRVTVTLTCSAPQTEAHMGMLGEALYIKGRTMLNNAAAAAGLPILE
jgi:hypothetical protein